MSKDIDKDIARFLAKVKKYGPDECWPYVGGKNPSGYGWIGFLDSKIATHRLMYHVVHPDWPLDSPLCVLHKCDNPACINPKHLFLGTHQDNMTDKKRKGRTTRANAKLSKLDIVRIFELCNEGLTQYQIAEKTGISAGHVSKILSGSQWNKETESLRNASSYKKGKTPTKLTQQQKDEIKSLEPPLPYKQLTKQYNVSSSTICRIRGKK